MRHRGFRLAGYPYRTDFDPCQGVIISELCLWKFPGIFTDTQRLSSLWTLYDHISRLCNHLWLHYPSDTTWVWTRVSRIWSALVARFEVHATTPTPCLPVVRSSTQCVIVSVPLREHCLTHCYMVLFTQQLHRLMNFVSYLQVSLPGFLSFLFRTASPLTPMSLRRTSGSYL